MKNSKILSIALIVASAYVGSMHGITTGEQVRIKRFAKRGFATLNAAELESFEALMKKLQKDSPGMYRKWSMPKGTGAGQHKQGLGLRTKRSGIRARLRALQAPPVLDTLLVAVRQGFNDRLAQLSNALVAINALDDFDDQKNLLTNIYNATENANDVVVSTVTYLTSGNFAQLAADVDASRLSAADKTLLKGTPQAPSGVFLAKNEGYQELVDTTLIEAHAASDTLAPDALERFRGKDGPLGADFTQDNTDDIEDEVAGPLTDLDELAGVVPGFKAFLRANVAAKTTAEEMLTNLHGHMAYAIAQAATNDIADDTATIVAELFFNNLTAQDALKILHDLKDLGLITSPIKYYHSSSEFNPVAGSILIGNIDAHGAGINQRSQRDIRLHKRVR